MKQISTYIILAIIAITSFTACNKAISDEFVSYPNNPLNDTTWSIIRYNPITLKKLLLPELTKTTIIDSFDCLVDNLITFGDSILIAFPGNACSSNGLPITNNGKIKIEITLLKKRGDFVKYATPTTNILALLEAGNFCDIKLSRDGQEVILNPTSQVKIKIRDSTANSDMKFFTGNDYVYNKDSIFSWAPSQDGRIDVWKEYNSGNSSGKTVGYIFTTSRIKWFGAAYFTDSLSAKTKVNVTLPPNYTNKNTAVFAVLKAKKTITNFVSDAGTKSFFTLNIPINSEASLVSISRINNDYYLGNKLLKVTNADPVNMLPEKKTLVQILDFLDKL